MRALLLVAVIGCGGAAKGPTIPRTAPPIPADDITVARNGAKPVSGGESSLAVKDPRVVDLDIIRIRAPQIGPDNQEVVATADLFRQAGDAHAAGNHKDAIARYRQLVTEFPESKYAPVSLFNIAAILDGQGDPTGTISTLHELITAYPNSRESIEGHLYIAALQSEKKLWTDAIATLDAVLARQNLTYADRVEADARKGYVLIELHKYDDADLVLAAAVAEWRKAPRIDETYYIAMASYYAGEIAHLKFTESPVRLPDDVLVADLETKRVLAVAAYDKWKSSLGFNHAYWGTAAGYQMSQIFVELWEVTVKAPYPSKLAATARQKYVVEVHDKVRPHLEKALKGHQANIELAKAYGVETSWSKGSATRAVQVLQMLQQDTSGNYVVPAP